MNSAIEMMLQRYNPKNNTERENAVREILQEIVLAGLSRGGFFAKTAFYGETCLHIFHGLDRYSEDLDFALTEKDLTFKLDRYFPSIEKEFLSYGIDICIESKRTADDANVKSAFVKGNTMMLLMSFFPKNEDAKKVVSNQKIKIKIEIDVDNPEGAVTEYRYRLLPAPYEIQIFNEESLFAGKIHAILCREYKKHVKGRDYYDYLFYLKKGVKLNLRYLENKLKNTGKIDSSVSLSLNMVKEMLRDKFNAVDYESAKEDVSNFIENKSALDIWKPALFISTLDYLEAGLF